MRGSHLPTAPSMCRLLGEGSREDPHQRVDTTGRKGTEKRGERRSFSPNREKRRDRHVPVVDTLMWKVQFYALPRATCQPIHTQAPKHVEPVGLVIKSVIHSLFSDRTCGQVSKHLCMCMQCTAQPQSRSSRSHQHYSRNRHPNVHQLQNANMPPKKI